MALDLQALDRNVYNVTQATGVASETSAQAVREIPVVEASNDSVEIRKDTTDTGKTQKDYVENVKEYGTLYEPSAAAQAVADDVEKLKEKILDQLTGEESPDNIFRLNEEDREILKDSLLNARVQEQQELHELVRKTIGEQYAAYMNAQAQPTVDSNGFWRFISGGNYAVDARTKQAAEQAIAEGGFYSADETSNRIFAFAQSIAGEDMDAMKAMQKAVLDGYQQAMVAWGGKLPELSKHTMDAANDLFDDFYEAHGVKTVAS